MAFAALATSVLLVVGTESTSIRGRVVDADGAPAAGVRVVLGEFGHATIYYNSPKQTFVATPGVPDAEHARYAAELATDAEGRFVATGLAPGEFSLVASDERRGIGLSNARVAENGTASVEIALVLPATIDADVAGLPFDASRDVVELVPVSNGSNIDFHPRLEPIPGEWGIRSAGLPALSGWRVVGTEIVSGQDYRATLFALPVQAEAGQRRRAVLDTAQGLELAGSVTGGDGKPLAGVSVVARELGDAPRELGAVTDAAGRYTIRGLANGVHVLEASRWKMRDLPGCGNGAQDVAASRDLVLPLTDAKEADLRIDGLLGAPKVGDPMPPFDARTLAGGALASRDLRGKVVLLDFWATWCPSCRVELPSLLGAYDALARDGRFEIVGVSVDSDIELVPRFVASRGVRWPQTALGPAARNPIARLFNVNSTPSTVLVDAQGRIAALNLLGEPLRRKIDELLVRK